MDLQALAGVLQACLSADQTQRKAAEDHLKQHELAQGHAMALLVCAGEASLDIAVRQVASISFKQLAKRNWEPEKDGSPCLAAQDKAAVRTALLASLIAAPPLIQSQLSEVLSTVVYCDYPDAWPDLVPSVMGHLTSNDHARMHGALMALRVIARKYEFRDEEERAPITPVINASFPTLLSLMQQLVANESPAPQVPTFMKLICKIFWSASFMAIPDILLQQEQFSGWMLAFHQAMCKPLPRELLPADPDQRAKWVWFKALKWVQHIVHRLFSRYGEPRLCSPGNDTAFAKLFEAHVSAQFLEDQLALLHPLASGQYMSPRVVNLALQYLTRAVELKAPYKQVKPHIEALLGQVVLPLMCFDDEDAQLWEEDPQEFVRKGYDVMEDLLGTKTSAANFVTTLAQKKPKAHLPWLMAKLVEVMNAHAAAAKAGPVPVALARQMDGAMLAIGALSDTLKAKDPYRSQLEALLSTHVVPNFASPHGHIRAKAAWLAKEFAGIDFSEGGSGGKPLFNQLLQCVINSLQDSELPVRVEGVMALRSFIEEADDVAPLKPILAQLMDSIFKLMHEVENEDLVFTLEVIVDKFGDDIAPYAVTLAQNLTAAFWKYSGTADDEDGDDDDGAAAIAAYGCLKALNTLLDGVAEMKHLLPVLEDIIFPIMARCISSDGQDMLEDVLELLAYFTYFGELTPRLWSLWPKLHALVMDFGIDYWENILIPLDNFVSRGTETYLTSSQPNYQESLFQMVQHTLTGDFDELSMVPAVRLLEVVLQNCPGKVDACLQPYLQLCLGKLSSAENRLLKDELLVLVANALYYNAAATLGLLRQFGAVQSLFGVWFGFIFERSKKDKAAHFKTQSAKRAVVLGLLSLLGQPDAALPPELCAGLPQLLRGLVRLLVDLKEQQEAAAAEDADDEGPGDTDGEEADDGSDDEGDAQLEEDDAYMQRLRKQALRMLKGEAGDDEDDEDWSEEEEEAVGSPLDDVNPFIAFADMLAQMQGAMPARYQALVSGADAGVLAALEGMSSYAQQMRAKEAAERQQAAARG